MSDETELTTADFSEAHSQEMDRAWEDEHPRKMTTQEIALLREVVRWRRASGVTFYLHRRAQGFAGPYGFGQWQRYGAGRRNRADVVFERATPDVLAYTGDYYEADFEHVRVTSVGQAVDILAAVGLLPARFSSAYRAGWDKAIESEHVGPDLAELPAVEAVR